MFTGIIRHVGRVLGVSKTSTGKRLTIDVGPLAKGLLPGQSVAVNGPCLTAAVLQGSSGQFDVIPETLSLTTLGLLSAGDRVNLEPALQIAQGLDGHLVQGHVDGMASLAAIRKGDQYVLEFAADGRLLDLMISKGSVAVSGVSLTLVNVTDSRFSVALIPTTLGETTLGDLGVGDKVNVETDVIGKYVRKYLEKLAIPRGRVTLDKLREEGFA